MTRTRGALRPSFYEFRERLWDVTDGNRELINALDEMYDRVRNECLQAVNDVAVKKHVGAVPPDSAFVRFECGDGDTVRVLALRYESVRAAVSRVFDRRRHPRPRRKKAH